MMHKKFVLLAFLTACTADSVIEADEYVNEALQLQDAIVPSAGVIAATITFDEPAAVATVVEVTDRYQLAVVGTYVYALHDDGTVGTMITAAPPSGLQAEIDHVLANERASLLGVGAIVVDMPASNVKQLQEQPEIYLVDVSGELAINSMRSRWAPSRAWHLLERRGFVDAE